MTASYLYLAVLALHVASLALFGGTVLAVDLKALGVAMRGYSAEELSRGLLTPRRIGLALALASGLALFLWRPELYLRDAWFWSKLGLLALLAINSARRRFAPKLAAGLSLLLWTGVIAAGRGPATVKDVMHSVVDPNGDAVFASVQQIGDEHGSHQEAPRTDADWAELRERLGILQNAPNLVEGRRAARMRDRSKNPQSESQPEEIAQALLADPTAVQRRAGKLAAAAALGIRAVDARDTNALLRSIDSIDKACENCHLHYWYPNDQRAQQAAREDGVTDY